MAGEKFTPGPWRHSPSRSSAGRNGFEAQVWDAAGKALLFFADYRSIGPEADANARLIAAAPDLYVACDGLLEMLGRSDPDDVDFGRAFAAGPEVAAVRAALKKARGEV
jgi:hypothetical protein